MGCSMLGSKLGLNQLLLARQPEVGAAYTTGGDRQGPQCHYHKGKSTAHATMRAGPVAQAVDCLSPGRLQTLISKAIS